MRALTKVKVISIILIGIVCVISGSFYAVLSEIEKAQHNALLADELEVELFERKFLTDEYLVADSPRARDQWFIKSDAIEALITEHIHTFTSVDDLRHLQEVVVSLEEGEKIFKQIVAHTEIATSSTLLLDIKIDHLFVQLTLQSQAGLTAASRLAQSNQVQIGHLMDVILILFFVASAFVLPVMMTGAWVVLRSVKNAKEIEDQKTQFLSMASHQLRTPLGSMRWNLEYILLEQGHAEFSPEIHERLQGVYDSNTRLIELVRNLLNVARIEAGRAKSEPAVTDVAFVLQSALEEMEAEATKRGIVLHKQVPPLPQVFLDPQRIREATQNLLSNAVKYTQKGGHVTLRANIVGKSVVVDVQDTGAGIPKTDQGKMFTKFFRADNAIRLDPDGNGLGLFIVKSFVEEWGGTLSFVSKEGVGTTFTYTIPLQK